METLIITIKLRVRERVHRPVEGMLHDGQVWVDDQLEKIKPSFIYEVKSSKVEVKDE